jgi:predicted double-glycine peptidase
MKKGAVIFFLSLCLTSITTAGDVRSLLELRQNDVVTQSYWWSCGAAAVATLLTHYYAIPVTEADVLTHIIQEHSTEQALSLLSLKHVLQAMDIESKAYRLDSATLHDYFYRGGLPLIIHLSYPRAHFVVGVGIVGDQIAIADPSYGERLVDWSTLITVQGFTGYVLVPIPPAEQIGLVYERQETALVRFSHRYIRLSALGGDLHYW